ncbi:MAG: serine carboxypeptidase S28-domain-containing protein [Monoraphidium minutum]|nr:MAG: serine carboxypeptidase S28-domain-containing protein [Monoraphidium minutum]
MWPLAQALVVTLLLVQGAAAGGVLDRCRQEWFEQRLDHFRWWPAPGDAAAAPRGAPPPPPRTWRQRYFVCDGGWRGPGAPIFFYAGNEGPVEGYIKSGGLMWRGSEAFGALLLWVEHRYYGESQPFGPDSWRVDPTFLTSRQAMADYANILRALKQQWGAEDSPVVAFGGSYGGMLAAWMRRHYPHLVAGAVAASAPVGQFPGAPGFRPAEFWKIVTKSATPEAGAPADCAPNVRAAFARLLELGACEDGRGELSRRFRLCQPLASQEDAVALAYWAQGAFDAYGMGSYPFASSYMGGTDEHPLPPWPMRAACAHMTADAAWLGRYAAAAAAAATGGSPAGAAAGQGRGLQGGGGEGEGEGGALLDGLRGAAGVLYNATGSKACFDIALEGPADGSTGAWDWQVCTEFMGQELPYFPANGVDDMFWAQGEGLDLGSIAAHCREAWGVEPVVDTHITMDGGLDYRGVTNIVFSNGLLDPWSAFGLLEAGPGVDASIVAVKIPDGGHHVDLMFDHPEDSPAIRGARATILAEVARWVEAPAPAPALAGEAAPAAVRAAPAPAPAAAPAGEAAPAAVATI